MLIDTHAHLASSKFKGDVDEIIKNAADAGVDRIIAIACDLEDSPVNIELAEKYPGTVYATVGIHPCYAHEIATDDYISELRKLSAHEKVVAIGEIGLDYYHAPPAGFTEETWRTRQAEVFRAQLDLAVKVDLPTVIHQRDSNADTMAILDEYRDTSLRAVLHCFTYHIDHAKRAFDLGHLVSFTGVVTYPKAQDVQEMAALVDGNKFMVETDCPYLTPVPRRGKRCEPADTKHTAMHLAKLRGVDFEKLASETTQTAEAFFKID
ncbi:MAG: TatD family hydrolase [Verrucomicrobiales bacterium]